MIILENKLPKIEQVYDEHLMKIRVADLILTIMKSAYIWDTCSDNLHVDHMELIRVDDVPGYIILRYRCPECKQETIIEFKVDN